MILSVELEIGTGIAMGKPYSQDLRERVMAAVDGGTGAYAAAPLFRVSSFLHLQGAWPPASDRRDDSAHRQGRSAKRSLQLMTKRCARRWPPIRMQYSKNCRRGLRRSARSRSASGACGTGCSV